MLFDSIFKHVPPVLFWNALFFGILLGFSWRGYSKGFIRWGGGLLVRVAVAALLLMLLGKTFYGLGRGMTDAFFESYADLPTALGDFEDFPLPWGTISEAAPDLNKMVLEAAVPPGYRKIVYLLTGGLLSPENIAAVSKAAPTFAAFLREVLAGSLSLLFALAFWQGAYRFAGRLLFRRADAALDRLASRFEKNGTAALVSRMAGGAVAFGWALFWIGVFVSWSPALAWVGNLLSGSGLFPEFLSALGGVGIAPVAAAWSVKVLAAFGLA